MFNALVVQQIAVRIRRKRVGAERDLLLFLVIHAFPLWDESGIRPRIGRTG